MLDVPLMTAAAPPSGNAGAVFVWVGLLILVTIGGGLAILFVRRRLLAKESAADTSAGLMQSLRAMRDRGEISPEEYEATRKAMAGKVLGRTPPRPTPPRQPPGP